MKEFNVSYTVWSQVADQHIYRSYEQQVSNQGSYLYTGNGDFAYISYVSSGSADHTDYIQNYSSISTQIQTRDDALALLSGINPENEQKVQFYSPNYCYKCSWYEDSTFHSSSVMVTADSGSGFVWDLPTPHHVVDVSHKKLVFEKRFSEYQPKIYVDGILKTEKDQDSGVGDWEMDYSTGRVTFDSSVSGSTVKIDHYEVGSSIFTVTPQPGTRLKIIETEIQASMDLSIKTDFVFQLRAEVGKHPLLEPYRIANGGPYPDGTRIPIQTNLYDSILCAVGESNLSYPRYLKTTNVNPTSRDLQDDIQIYSWDYLKQREINLYDAWGMDLKIWLDNDVELGGWAAIVTIYATSTKI